ncbi:NAD(P)/FAD-dependent oxidoreductase [Ascidiaceihabitans sp.]|uniref:NAD(P)/FAD-dependent oxidoreductase n=1 Tax=Ascidiaceihabitans sp. TaxID=1872644 RepID=UPI003296B6B6
MKIDTLIIGAGAAGLMCAAHAPGHVLIVDHAKKPGEKIRISGGGRCNFTNMYCEAHAFLSQNPHFAKSALARYTQWDFVELVDSYGIKWHEKTLGQLFCDVSAKDIVAMLLDLCAKNEAEVRLETSVKAIEQNDGGYSATLVTGSTQTRLSFKNLVIATGGKSIPKMGATGFAYDVAHQFSIPVTDIRPALVPFTFPENRFTPLAGVALPSRVTAGAGQFDEAMLFTHRGLSGPAVLQASSYWVEGDVITLNIDPANTLMQALRDKRQTSGRKNLTTELATLLPGRLVEFLTDELALNGNLADQSDARLRQICEALQNWQLTPNGTEGYRTAEVTLGGIDTNTLSSKTMECKTVPGLYFIGEAVDVTGWLGGYNFQWAWASGMACARSL